MWIAIVTIIGLGGAVLWAVSSWRPRITIGQPTPEEARVKIERAEKAADAATDAKVKEVRDAPPDDAARRTRERIRRGLHDK